MQSWLGELLVPQVFEDVPDDKKIKGKTLMGTQIEKHSRLLIQPVVPPGLDKVYQKNGGLCIAQMVIYAAQAKVTLWNAEENLR